MAGCVLATRRACFCVEKKLAVDNLFFSACLCRGFSPAVIF